MPHSQFTEWALKNLNTKVGEQLEHFIKIILVIFGYILLLEIVVFGFQKKGYTYSVSPLLGIHFLNKYGFFPDSGIFPFFLLQLKQARSQS